MLNKHSQHFLLTIRKDPVGVCLSKELSSLFNPQSLSLKQRPFDLWVYMSQINHWSQSNIEDWNTNDDDDAVYSNTLVLE